MMIKIASHSHRLSLSLGPCDGFPTKTGANRSQHPQWSAKPPYGPVLITSHLPLFHPKSSSTLGPLHCCSLCTIVSLAHAFPASIVQDLLSFFSSFFSSSFFIHFDFMCIVLCVCFSCMCVCVRVLYSLELGLQTVLGIEPLSHLSSLKDLCVFVLLCFCACSGLRVQERASDSWIWGSVVKGA